MPTTIAHTSQELVKGLLYNAFHDTDDSIIGMNKRDDIITTAKEYGLNELAEELEENNI